MIEIKIIRICDNCGHEDPITEYKTGKAPDVAYIHAGDKYGKCKSCREELYTVYKLEEELIL